MAEGNSNLLKRLTLGAFAALLIFEMLAVAIFLPVRPAHAQGAPDVVAELRLEAVERKVALSWDQIARLAIYQALLNAVTFFLQTIAYDTAVWVASGDSGQKPLLFTSRWGDYLEQAGQAAAGEFVGSLSEGLAIRGVNLCSPNLSVILNIQLGIRAQYKRPTPRCTWNQLAAGYWDEQSGIFRQEGFKKQLNNFGVAFEPGQAPLSAAIQVNRQAFSKELLRLEAAKGERQEGQGFKSVTELITGRVTTPSQTVKQQFESQLDSGKKINELSIEGAFANADVGWALVNTVLNTFANTLFSKWTERIMGGFFSIGDLFSDPFDVELARPGGLGGRQAARQVFAEFTAVPIRSIESYDLLGEYELCPSGNPGPNNCVIDSNFAAAVRLARSGRSLTVREAIESNSPQYLRGDLPILPPGFRDQDKDCYRQALCYSNLVKLRRARIIPVGWELAAMRSDPGSPATLQQVIDGFDRCNEDGTGDPDDLVTRWCHLINPNWVLKYPITQCRQLAFGSTLVDGLSNRRIEVCVDTPSCNAEDGQGNCTGGFGYCTRERNIWRFEGDSCPAYYASCDSLAGADGRQLALLTNTVDFGVCNADNVGCRWRSALPDPDSALGWDSNSRLYFNGRAPVCQAADAGCTELVPHGDQLVPETAVTLNLARNSGFEEDRRDPAGSPDFWEGSFAEYNRVGGQAHSGSAAVRMAAGQSLEQRIAVSPNQFYTFSFYARRAGAAGRARLEVALRNASDGTGDLELDRYFISSTCERAGDDRLRSELVTDNQYERQSCTFTAPATAVYLLLRLSAPAGVVWLDGIQLEEGETVSPYANGYSGPGADRRVYLRAPPPGLCSGNSTDPEICASYAAVCSAVETGCELFQPRDGSASIPGIAGPADQCPAACVGYETFREEPTHFNPDGEYPLYFIPDTAQSCATVNAGCDEFTNLGNEGREYFTYLRLCEEPTPGDDTGTFYTWEGSDEEGFQLRVWQLKLSRSGSTDPATDPSAGIAPCTNYNAQNGTCSDPVPFDPPETCNEASDIFLFPDCREFYDTAGNIHYRLASRTIIKTEECTDYRKTLAYGQSACNESGGRWEAATGQCFYRAYVPDSASCPAAQNMCRLYTGNAARNLEVFLEDGFEGGLALAEGGAAGRGGWIGAALSNESLAATGHSVRPAGDNALGYVFDGAQSARIEDDTFLLSFWARGEVDARLSIQFDGASAEAADQDRFSYYDVADETPTSLLGSAWQFYEVGPVTVDFDPRTSNNRATLQISSNEAGNNLFVDNVRLTRVREHIALIRDSWNTPAACDATLEGAYSPQEMLGCAQYRDRAGNTMELRSFSSLCREEAVGCRAFFDTHNSVSPYGETWNYICMRPDLGSGLCSVDPDGAGTAAAREVCVIAPGRDRCQFRWDEALVADPADVYDPPINLRFVRQTVGNPSVLPFFYEDDLAVVPADSSRYLVDTGEMRCRSEAVGCTALGNPVFNQERTEVTEFENAYWRNLPDQYNEFLCTDEALFCDAWRDRSGETLYFKDPLEQTCEYRAQGPGGTRGWFRTGTNEACYSNFLSAGTDYGIWTNESVCTRADGASGVCPQGAVGDAVQCVIGEDETSCTPYEGWAGACTRQFSGCTEFLDPADTAPNEDTGMARFPDGRPHYALDNDRLNEEFVPPTRRCEGQASLVEGCALFNDTSDSTLRWNGAATYLKSQEDNFALVAPVDCVNPADGDERYCYVCIPGGVGSARPCVQGEQDGLVRDGVLIELRGRANDANRIQKVRRDRECAEWLACNQPEEVWDPRTGEKKIVCSSVDVCEEALSGGRCRYVIDKPPAEVLSAEVYQNRGVDWYSREYSGYAIPGIYPVDALRGINVGVCVQDGSILADGVDIPGPEFEPEDRDFVCNNDNLNNTDDCGAGQVCAPHFRLARVLGPCRDDVAQGAGCLVGRCPQDGNRACATDDDCSVGSCNLGGGESGQCFSGQCARASDGSSIAGRDGSERFVREEAAPPSACRIYPEVTSPLPNEVVTSWLVPDDQTVGADGQRDVLETRPGGVVFGFQNAEFCSQGQNCECTYQKVTYETGEIKYYTASNAGLNGICTSGDVGKSCLRDDECDLSGAAGEVATEGSCAIRKRSDEYLGLSGFCLERDRATSLNGQADNFACLTWYPVDSIAGSRDVFSQVDGVAFETGEGNEWYCAEGNAPPTADYEARDPDDGLSGPTLDYALDIGTLYCAVFDSSGNCLQSGQDVSYDADILAGLFGEPQHPLTGVNSCPEGSYDCMTPSHHAHSGSTDYDCENRTGGSWCGWPQQRCNVKGWHDLSNSQGFCRNYDNEAGPHGTGGSDGLNFFGCYEIAGGGTLSESEIRFPWNGPPIYKWQVEAYRVSLAESNVLCQRYSGEGDDDWLGDVISEPLPPDHGPDSAIAFSGGSAEAPNNGMNAYPIWDNQERLVAFGVQARDGSEEGTFYISGLAFHFWPTCWDHALVGDSRGAPYADLLMRTDAHSDPQSAPFGRDSLCQWWGGICGFDGDTSTLPGRAAVGPAGSPSMNQAQALYSVSGIRQLFARATRVLRYGALGGGNDRTLSYDNDDYELNGVEVWDQTESADSGAINAPKVRAVGDCDAAGSCDELVRDGAAVEGLTVNGRDFGEISGRRQVRATIRFFGWAEPNRMPIRQLAVDWGDHRASLVKTYNIGIKNRRGRGECDNELFGQTPETCDTRPFTYVQDYTCSQAQLNRLPECSALDGQPGGRHVGAYTNGGPGGCREGNSCVFVPRVQLVDNWGWCTGDCPDAPGGGGCYDGDQNTGTPTSVDNECREGLPRSDIGATPVDESQTDPWVYFAGRIVVDAE